MFQRTHCSALFYENLIDGYPRLYPHSNRVGKNSRKRWWPCMHKLLAILNVITRAKAPWNSEFVTVV